MLGCLVLFLLLSALFQTSLAVTDGLLPNGDFKDSPRSTELNGTENLKSLANMHCLNGRYQALLSTLNMVTCKLSRGSYYAITFSAVRTCAQAEQLNVSVSPESSLVPMQTIYSSIGWDSYAWGFQAKFSKVDLVIHNPGVDEDPSCGPLIDSVAIQTLYPPPPTNDNMLRNGDFEEGPYLFANVSWGVMIPPMTEDVHSPLPAWMVESLKAVKYIDSNHYSVPQGKRAVELVAGRESALAQVVSTTPGKNYSLTFSVGDAGDSCIGYMMVEAYADRGIVRVPYESNGTGGFKKADLQFVATGNTTRVVFLSSNYHMKVDGSLCGPVIDDVVLCMQS
ncbi:hypothetical protein LUZ62_033923 [Rhynchospora pubera]|uniref:DUF642 domain-containing protein n=1 Tax=Rhynchospora pubera TaxID=906938 RepID=A0AAV8I073_9POAL|nr:hypothetical protein LUZ62_033923 [Rhynchospora pubera]